MGYIDRQGGRSYVLRSEETVLSWRLSRCSKKNRRQPMPFRVSGKNIEVGEALRERISARVLEALEKYFDGGFSGHVTVGKEAFGFNTECVVHLDSGIVLRADSMAADAYLSADQAAEKLEKRLRRYHGKLKDYHANG